MPDADISITGGRELYDQLRGLADKLVANVLTGAAYAGLKPIRDLARAKVPILDIEASHGPHAPGELLEGIRLTRSRSRDRNSVGARLGITRDVYWGHFVEYGTRHAAAKPFMRPAADEGRDESVRAFVEYAGKRVEAEAKRR
jgi:HK97 gp10 family phage protein